MIDIKTFMLVLAMGNIGFAMLMAGYARGAVGNPALRLWTWAKLVQGCAQLLGFMRPDLPYLWVSMAANTALVAGIALEVGAYSSFFSLRFWNRLVVPFALLAILALHGARLGGAIAKAVGSAAPAGRVRARFEGAAGQSFGAFLTAGVELDLVGEANDYVGKSMSGGRILIAPPPGDAGEPCLVGNTVLYGATGGELYCAGSAGERFAVRNSGATAVVEGVGDHACEYMTRGTVVVLGPHGRNLGAGMTGGEAFLLEPDERLVNDELVTLLPLEAEDADRLARLLERHMRATGSARAAALLEEPTALAGRFRRLLPRALVVDLDGEVERRLSA